LPRGRPRVGPCLGADARRPLRLAAVG
jgi:hypothetical protein